MGAEARPGTRAASSFCALDVMTAVKRGQAFEMGSFPDPKRGFEFAAASARACPAADLSQNHFL